jgi:hypothetical protein
VHWHDRARVSVMSTLRSDSDHCPEFDDCPFSFRPLRVIEASQGDARVGKSAASSRTATVAQPLPGLLEVCHTTGRQWQKMG